MADDTHTDRPRRESRSVAKRLRTLSPELRTAGIAAACLVASMVLPWYVKNYAAIVGDHAQALHANLSAFGVFTFIEAAVLVVAAGVLVLVWARANQRAFHLPGGDGTVIFAAGCWVLLLLVWRLFDKPDSSDPRVSFGLQWGFVGAFLAAGFLTAAGARVRAAHRPEPPNPAADDEGWQRPPRRRRERRPDRRPHDPGAVTEVLSDPPLWHGEPPEPPGRTRRGDTAPDPSEAETRRGPAGDAPPHDRLF